MRAFIVALMERFKINYLRPAGYYTALTGAKMSSTCTICRSGTYSAAGEKQFNAISNLVDPNLLMIFNNVLLKYLL